MVEAIAAAVVTALLSAGSASAMAAARRSGETRDAVLQLVGRVESLERSYNAYTGEARSVEKRLQAFEMEQADLLNRVQALEAGVVNRRQLHRE